MGVSGIINRIKRIEQNYKGQQQDNIDVTMLVDGVEHIKNMKNYDAWKAISEQTAAFLFKNGDGIDPNNMIIGVDDSDSFLQALLITEPENFDGIVEE